MANSRLVKIDGDTLTIQDRGKKTLRLPGSKDVVFGVTDKRIEWRYTKFNFIAEGINIELVKDDVVCAATTYGNEQIIPVLRIKGENIITRITVNDK
jgi:hypothetical protein